MGAAKGDNVPMGIFRSSPSNGSMPFGTGERGGDVSRLGTCAQA